MACFFCPCCWREVAEQATHCHSCGADIQADDSKSFAEKLRRALRHPEAQTPIRAAWILGQLRESSAVADLMAVVESTRDSLVVEAAVEALGKIGAAEALTLLEKAQQQGTVRVRQAAREALERIRCASASSKSGE